MTSDASDGEPVVGLATAVPPPEVGGRPVGSQAHLEEHVPLDSNIVLGLN